MAIRKIRFIGDPCLNKVCKPVQKITPSIETLIEDMFDTMYSFGINIIVSDFCRDSLKELLNFFYIITFIFIFEG